MCGTCVREIDIEVVAIRVSDVSAGRAEVEIPSRPVIL